MNTAWALSSPREQGAEVDRTTAVLSIRPVYADRILAGTKTIEFRRKPLPEQVTTVLIWRTGRDGGLVGRFDIGDRGEFGVDEFITELDDGSDWTSEASGIAPDELMAYAGGALVPIWAMSIRDLVRFPRFVAREVLGFDRGPQSWRYAPAGWRPALDLWLRAGGRCECRGECGHDHAEHRIAIARADPRAGAMGLLPAKNIDRCLSPHRRITPTTDAEANRQAMCLRCHEALEVERTSTTGVSAMGGGGIDADPS